MTDQNQLLRVLDDFERKERGIPQAMIAADLVRELRTALAAQLAEGGEAALYVSPEQFATFKDKDDAPFGTYLPARKTPAGKFTQALYTAPPASPASAEGVEAVVKLTHAEMNLCRQWFDAVEDLSRAYLGGDDYALAKKLREAIGMRVSNRVNEGATTPPASQEQCSGPLCGLPEFGGNCHPLCKRASHSQAQQPSGYAKALEIRVSQGWKLTGEAIPVLYTDTINGEQVMRDDVWLCTTDALKQQPSGEVVTRESALEAIEHVEQYNGHGRAAEARRMLVTPKPEPMTLRLVCDLLKHIEQNTCTHEETHRGGVIWEICDSCGAKWADDEGGKPEFVWPDVVERARKYLAHHGIKGQA